MGNIIEFVEETSTNMTNFILIEGWLKSVISAENKSTGTITYVFMDDENLLEYNKKYLSHDFYTDVITFDDSNFPEVSGDILISIDRIMDNSKMLSTESKEEFLRVLVHGILHLCGYKDKSENEEKEMRSKEAFYLKQIDFTI